MKRALLLLLAAGCSNDISDDLDGPNLVAPGDLAGVAVSGTQVRLSWSEASTGETSFRIDMAPVPIVATSDVTGVAFAPADATSHLVDVPTSSTTYFRVLAISDTRQSTPSGVISVTTVAPPPTPASLDAVAVSSSRIDLSWLDVIGETGYRLERSADGGATWTVAATPPGDATFFSDAALAADTEYLYRLFATNSAGDSAASNLAGSPTVTALMNVSTAADGGLWSSIAVTAAGIEHISHHGGSSDCLYTSDSGGPFATVIADSGPTPFSDIGNEGTSIALDALGAAHIAAYDFGNGDLRYATNAGGSFVAATIDSVGNVGHMPKIKIHSDGTIHIVYRADSTLKLATFSGGAWSFETITPPEFIGSFSFTLDAAGAPHVSYQRILTPFDYQLVYALRAGGAWSFDIVPGAGQPVDNSIAIDAALAAHVVCYDYATRSLMHATNAGGVWTFEPVDSSPQGGDVGRYNSIAIDVSSGRIHVAYSDAWNRDLRYARKDPAGAWVRRVVDATGAVGSHASIAVDASGAVHVSYRDEGNSRLKRASGAP